MWLQFEGNNQPTVAYSLARLGEKGVLKLPPRASPCAADTLLAYVRFSGGPDLRKMYVIRVG